MITHPKAPSSLLVVEHKIIDQQMAYLIVNGSKRSWVKLCEANDNQTTAILKYESDINRGIEPSYYPEADDNNELRTLRNPQDSAGPEMKTQAEYNLRERELLLISMFDFYGIKTDEEKKQVILKSKKEVTKQEQKPNNSQNRDYNYGSRLKKQEIRGLNKLEINSLRAKGKRANQDQTIIDVERLNPKRKLIKKQEPPVRKDKHTEIQIYDGSDSELKML